MLKAKDFPRRVIRCELLHIEISLLFPSPRCCHGKATHSSSSCLWQLSSGNLLGVASPSDVFHNWVRRQDLTNDWLTLVVSRQPQRRATRIWSRRGWCRGRVCCVSEDGMCVFFTGCALVRILLWDWKCCSYFGYEWFILRQEDKYCMCTEWYSEKYERFL